MSEPALLWNENAACAALETWLGAVFGPTGLAASSIATPVPLASIYRSYQNAPEAKPPSIRVLLVTPAPVTDGYLPDTKDVVQRQRVRITVDAAQAGDYTAVFLGEDATYPAVGGESVIDIRDGWRLVVDGLGLPVTTSAVGTSAFDVLADAAFNQNGDQIPVSLGGLVTAGPATRSVIDDNTRRYTATRGLWTTRLVFDDIQGDAGSPDLSRTRAEAARSFFEGGSTLPVTNGYPGVYLNDLLDAGGIAYNATVGGPLGQSFQQGPIWVTRTVLDIRFTALTGVAHDVPSLDVLGVSQITVEA